MKLFRLDKSELGAPEKLPNGWIRVDSYISRTGIQIYHRDGKEWREYRPPDEVFAKATLDSFACVPVTNNHPPAGHLDAYNTRAYQVGTVETPVRADSKTRARLLITDAATIADLDAGKRQLSCGYMCDLEETPGVTPEGERYDAVQRNIVGNHVALVDAARGGPELTVRLDAQGAILDASRQNAVPSPSPEKNTVELKEALEKLAAEKVRADNAEKSAEGLKAHVDAAEKKIQALESTLKEAPAKLRAELKARADLEASAREVLGTEIKLDGKSDREIKVAVINDALGLEVADKSDAYVDASFDLALKGHKPAQGSNSGRVDEVDDGSGSNVNDAVQKYQAKLDSFFKRGA